MKPLMVGAIGGGAAVVIAVIVVFVFLTPVQQYALYVDARTESGDGTTDSRVTIINTGSQSLTNVKISYDVGKPDMIPALSPGERVIVSPYNTAANAVTVTDDQGLTVTKAFSKSSE